MLISYEVPVQQVWRNVELVIAVSRHLVFPCSDHRYAVLAHQTADTAVTDIQSDLFQLFGHPWAATLGT